MLHHYNYSTTLSHFLNYRQMEENEHAPSSSICEEIGDQFSSKCKNQSSEINSKSFTIAAILGLKNNNNNNNDPGDLQNSATDLSVVNLSVHPSGTTTVSNCNRLQLPVRHSSSAVGVTTHYSVGHGCPPRQTGEYQVLSIIFYSQLHKLDLVGLPGSGYMLRLQQKKHFKTVKKIALLCLQLVFFCNKETRR